MVPQFEEFLFPFLLALKDGNLTKEDMKAKIVDHFSLTAEDCAIKTRGGQTSQLDDRIGWCRQYFKRAKFIDSPKRGVYAITQRGLDYLANHTSLSKKDLMEYPEFAAFVSSNGQDVDPTAFASNNGQDIDHVTGLLKLNKDLSLQQIFFGTPGAGKSFEVNKRVNELLAGLSKEEKEEHVFRTTFHPDSDYASFVGCYKPVEKKTEPSVQTELLDETQLIEKLKEYLKNNKVMTNAYVQFGYDYCDSLKNYIADKKNKLITIVKAARDSNDPTTFDTTVKAGMELFENQMKESLTGSKITYSFVPQTFTKAYVAAWKSYTVQSIFIPAKPEIRNAYKNRTDIYTLDKVESGQKGEFVKCTKVSLVDSLAFEKGLKYCWNKLAANSKANINSVLPQAAVCRWYTENNPNNQSAEECWKAFWEALSHGETISRKARDEESGRQTYSFSLEDGKIVITTEQPAYKNKIMNQFEEPDENSISIQKLIADKIKDEYSEEFEEGWKKLKEVVNIYSGQPSDIAGTDSVLPIFLIIEEINRGNCAQIFGDLFQLLDRDKDGYSEYAIDADADLADYIKKELAACDDSKFRKAGVKEGKKLVLPPNLYIWATMNTSDQSLFPMDSAFKRRWSWEYIPIEYNNEKSSKFTITIGGIEYSWSLFLKKINEEIKKKTSSEDKQMGNFFIKQNVDEKEFKDKVMFYIWSEVGKENYNTPEAVFKNKDDKEFSFNELYGKNATELLKGFLENLDNTYFTDEHLMQKDEVAAPEPAPQDPVLNMPTSNEDIL